jgi:tRNA pseudouridine38-40 synthase
MMRYKLTIEYDGTAYCGFQKQKNLVTKSIEETVENAIFSLTGERVKITACGRTDAGVHALFQVIHFDLKKKFDNHKMFAGLNHYLREDDIAILNCEMVDEKFHARLSTIMRSYRYIIVNRRSNLTLDKNHAYHVVKKLDIEAMKEAAKFLIGRHDFSSFRDAECQGKSPIKTVKSITIEKDGEKIVIEIKAKSFLHHMVRNIVGTLVWAGNKKITPEEMKEILEAKDRSQSGPNAPSCGLYFLQPEY